MRRESTQRHMGALYERISENYRASYGGEGQVEVGADTRAFRRSRATRDGTIHKDRVLAPNYSFALPAVSSTPNAMRACSDSDLWGMAWLERI
ncbi:uncharacterized protein BDR25DRAFT_353684 [Lindgomyces ingoldianus]|uniref:Uncharacterized protein n=1 Tax=Lindgomyces ingoldianus TaxID=673940 RepID=A0ACB6R0Q2_9PLEO|nr:uncharacterized protein BDR25DRAFT_353684 [Lindgomyces ingoldianus]KAF2471905.1 hypothetical protein BDR25DRAFT_353684 [Lindgomyces ingoldianus]